MKKELEKLTDWEIIYLINNFTICKTKYIDSDSQIFTYIFDNIFILKLLKDVIQKKKRIYFTISKEIFYFTT